MSYELESESKPFYLSKINVTAAILAILESPIALQEIADLFNNNQIQDWRSVIVFLGNIAIIIFRTLYTHKQVSLS